MEHKPTPESDGADPSLSPTILSALKAALAVADQPRAELITSPHHLAAETMGKVFGVDPDALSQSLQTSAEAIHGGSLAGVEGTLASQATTLNSLFHRLAQFAFNGSCSLDVFSGHMKLALRAQAQSAKALEMLANIKQGPRLVIAGQLNAAHQQIVNNHPESADSTAAREARIVRLARKPISEPGIASPALSSPALELITPSEHASLDPRSPREATPVHPPLAAVDSVHRTQKLRRKANQQPERRSRGHSPPAS